MAISCRTKPSAWWAKAVSREAKAFSSAAEASVSEEMAIVSGRGSFPGKRRPPPGGRKPFPGRRRLRPGATAISRQAKASASRAKAISVRATACSSQEMGIVTAKWAFLRKPRPFPPKKRSFLPRKRPYLAARNTKISAQRVFSQRLRRQQLTQSVSNPRAPSPLPGWSPSRRKLPLLRRSGFRPMTSHPAYTILELEIASRRQLAVRTRRGNAAAAFTLDRFARPRDVLVRLRATPEARA